MASLVIDDPGQLEDRFFETTVRITKTEFREIIRALPDGEIRRKLEFLLPWSNWEIDSSAVRCALTNNGPFRGLGL